MSAFFSLIVGNDYSVNIIFPKFVTNLEGSKDNTKYFQLHENVSFFQEVFIIVPSVKPIPIP